jgi:predicted nucleic acid-binding protein
MTLEGASTPVVFDCNVLFQALTSAMGPSRAIIDASAKNRIRLVLSEYVLQEFNGVVSRPHDPEFRHHR